MTYQDFVRDLADREFFGQRLGLDRVQLVLNRLGNPEKKFPSIHIAGTNGKGSTAAMIASIFQEAGIPIGLYTSPHVNDFCERIRIGDRQISQSDVLRLAAQIQKAEEEPLTFFELTTVMMFLYFAENEVPLSVIEAGLGGRLDATNVVTPIISVITSVGFDHMAHLGDTLEKIAQEKAGIIKVCVPVVVGPVDPEVRSVLEKIAKERMAPVTWIEKGLDYDLGLAGEHQAINAAMAIEVVRSMKLSTVEEEVIQRGLKKVVWPGRLETVREKPWILLDGAHNVPAMRTTVEFLKKESRDRKIKVMFAAMSDKDILGVLHELEPVTSEIILPRLSLKRAASPEEVGSLASRMGFKFYSVESVDAALIFVLENLKDEDILLIAGSFVLVGEARKWFKEN